MVDGCGISCWHPNWLQRFANTRWFMIVYGLLGTVQATSYLYFVVTLTTIEKRYKIPSQTTGIILSGNEISQILLSLVLTYFGGSRNRPKWIAWGVVLSALSCFMLAWPHFIYGAGEEALQYTQEYTSKYQNVPSVFESRPINTKNNKLCVSTSRKSNVCEDDEVFSYVPLILIFMSQFVLGIASTLYYSLGQSYLDDYTKQRKTPLMLAYAFSMRLFGPTIGYGLAYLVMNIYIDPRFTPTITRDDPRWLGAYWLGWNILGAIMFLFAGLIGLFPKHLPKQTKKIVEYEMDGEKCIRNAEIVAKHENMEEGAQSDSNFSSALMRLLKNKLLIYNNIAGVLYILGSAGSMTYMGRMMEVQFNRSSHGGSILRGPVTLFGTAIGLLTSGYVITKFKPAPKYLFLWNVFIGLVLSLTQVYYTQIGCGGDDSLVVNGSVISCNANCNCDGISYSPVCDRSTGITYFSPCHAGCRIFDKEANVYNNCTCSTTITSPSGIFRNDVSHKMLSKRSTPNASFFGNNSEIEGLISNGALGQLQSNRVLAPQACARDCNVDYYIFTLVSMITGFLGSTGRIGNVILNFRAVEQRDKSISQGLSLSLVSLFAMMPGPIIFGRVIDSTCLIWNFKCGRKGNCQLYDPIMFSYYFHLTSAFFIILGAFFDLLVWYYGLNLKLYGDEEPQKLKKWEGNDESPECQPLNEL